jgi:N-acetylglucosamine malate deacetylase 2
LAHPDDETIALGGQLNRFEDLIIIIVTDGAPRNNFDARLNGFTNWHDYAAARLIESEAVMALAGIRSESVIRLDIPDKEVALHLIDLSETLAAVINDRGLDLLFTHAYEGGHTDHDATAFAVHAAVRLNQQRRMRTINIIEMPFYHWNNGVFIAQQFCDSGPIPEIKCEVQGQNLALKKAMLAGYRSQSGALAAFDPAVERFRLAPRHKFRQQSAGSDFGYHRITPRIDFSVWTCLVHEASSALGLM